VIAFVAGEDGYVYTANPDAHGRPLRQLTRGSVWGAIRIAWSPDGSRLAYVSERAGPRVVLMARAQECRIPLRPQLHAREAHGPARHPHPRRR
jgi:Tol biopolymer transport system component